MRWRRASLVLTSLVMALTSLALSCEKAEFRCRSGRCVPQNVYCDGADHCGDKSDEPPHCTPCNRTYYGLEGRSYSLELRPPRRDRLPHICQLTFVADGGAHGDLLELVFDTFSLGRFTSHVNNGCPDGHMQIAEVGRIDNDGFWCGTGWGYNVYYSETGTVTVTFRLYRLSGGSSFGGDEASQFYVKLRYKFISRLRAVMRNGPKGSKYRGVVVLNSFCDFMFDNCDRNQCRIQSPNFPGFYPRNVTCSYHLTHSSAPPGTRALLELSQSYGELINIKDSDMVNGAVRQLRTWSKCDLVRDYVTVYDGLTKSAPIVLKFCAGGVLPAIVSSGPNMIVEFRSSAFDRLSQPTFSIDKLKYPTSYIPGFELNVNVRFVNISERTKIVSNHRCQYTFSSTMQDRGTIYSPAHSLPSNTTCTYELLGRSHQRLWLYFTKYHVTYHDGHPERYGQDAKSRHCHHRLDLIDGAPGGGVNRSLGFFCGDTKPLLCARARRTRGDAAVPACDAAESYLSDAENVTLIQQHVTGLGLDTAAFELHYEFIDMREDGQQLGDHPCHRVFASRGRLSKGTFGPAKNVFLYGRGGKTQLRCLFRFEGTPGERVRIVVNKLTAADTSGCETVYNERLQRYQCRYHGSARSELRVAELPWPGVRVWRDCVCADMQTGGPISISSMSSVLELRWDVFNMTAEEDFYSYSFMAKYEFLRKTACKVQTRVNGSSGTLSLQGGGGGGTDAASSPCDALPWLLEASVGAHLYLSVAGRREAPGACGDDTRLVVSAPDVTRPLAVICPGGADMVEVFSESWWRDQRRGGVPVPEDKKISRAEDRWQQEHELQRHLVLQLISPAGKQMRISWLELVRPTLHGAGAGSPAAEGPRSSQLWTSTSGDRQPCHRMCPGLAGGCISPALWCDGTRHCPSGKDEDPDICRRWSMPWLYIGVGASALCIILILSVAALLHQKQKRPAVTCDAALPGVLTRDGHQKRLPTDETLASGGVLYSASSSLKNGKDLISVPSTYSMDSADVDLVETTV